MQMAAQKRRHPLSTLAIRRLVDRRRLNLLGAAAGSGNLDTAGLLILRHVAHQIDVKQTVLERGALHFNMIGELEASLEAARSDTTIQDLGAVIAFLLLRLAALDAQDIAMR